MITYEKQPQPQQPCAEVSQNTNSPLAEYDFQYETIMSYRASHFRSAYASDPETPVVEPDTTPETTPSTAPVPTPDEAPEEIPGLVPAPDADPVPDQCPITFPCGLR